MAVKYETIRAGDVLYDVHRVKMGNTTMSRLGWWPVYVESICDGGAMVRWNGNPARFSSKRNLSKLRRSQPKAKP